MNAKDFLDFWSNPRQGVMYNHSNFLVPNFRDCPVDVLRECDNPACKKLTVKICFCGESYCSRICQRSDWQRHKKICYAVYDNAEAPLILSALEFSDVAQAALRHRWTKLSNSGDGKKKKLAHTADGTPSYRQSKVACAQCSKTDTDLPAGKKLDFLTLTLT